MSEIVFDQLDNILEDFRLDSIQNLDTEQVRLIYKQQIKEMIYQLIDKDENDPISNARWQAYRNELRAELRQKVEAL